VVKEPELRVERPPILTILLGETLQVREAVTAPLRYAERGSIVADDAVRPDTAFLREVPDHGCGLVRGVSTIEQPSESIGAVIGHSRRP
jgi:hypothetical protein